MQSEEKRLLSAIKNSYFFQCLNDNELEQLASQFVLETLQPQDIFVKENDDVVDFCIILSGKAEVWVGYGTDKPSLVATLSEHDSIGHLDIEIKEPIKRNATVIAVKPMEIMKVPVSVIEPYLHQYPQIQENFQNYRQRINTINFIKSSTPFIDISYETANELVDKISYINVGPDAVIIKQGDLADACYLIEEGTVTVFINDEAGQEKAIKELSRGDLFGELGLFEGHRRNATIRTQTKCRLLMIKREHFLTVLTRHSDVARKVSYLSKHRNRPKRQEGIEVIEQKNSAGKIVYILKNPKTHKYLKIHDEGWYLWREMDGIKTIHELIIGYFESHGKFLPSQIMKLILDLDDLGMIEITYYKQAEVSKSFKNKILYWLTRLLEMKYSFRNVDGGFTKIYNAIGPIIYNKITITCLSFLILVGIVFFLRNAPTACDLFQYDQNNYRYLIYVYLLLPFTISLHEFAHGLTAKSVGCEVGGFGVGWYWFGPIAFCDTTDAWIAPTKDRIKVNIAGIFSDLCIAGIASIISDGLMGSTASVFFWFLATMFYVNSIVNLGTLIELDGYYVLSDLLDEPNLRRKAFLWIDSIPKQIFRPSLLLDNYKSIIYWVVTLLHLTLVVTVYTQFQNRVIFYALPEAVYNNKTYLQLIIPMFLIITMFLSVRADIKKYRRT